MRKWIRFGTPFILIFILTSFRYNGSSELHVPKSLQVNDLKEVDLPQQKTILVPTFIVPPFVGSTFIGFKEALAFKESRGNYFVTNTFGYMGKYQFGKGTLDLIGIKDGKDGFLKNPALQEKAFRTNLSRNKWILRRDITRFVGKRINGIEITESGILAAAHLAGAGNVKKYLRSYGDHDFEDGFGTTISYYFKKFAGYDLTGIDPVKNPTI